MPKWVKFLIALPLLLVCVAAGQTLWQVLRECGSADITLVPLGGGVACWLAISEDSRTAAASRTM